MRPRPILAMGLLYIIVQLGAVILAPLFLPYRGAFPDPNDPVNPLVYIVMVLVMTGIMLVLMRFGRQRILQIIFYMAIFITLFYVFNPILFEAELRIISHPDGWLSLIGALLLAITLLYALVRSGEWHIINAVGLILAIGITAILGIILGPLPAMILLVAMAIYDAIAVYKTKHMVTLARGMVPMRMPVMFVVPNKKDFSMDQVVNGVGTPSKEKRERDAFFMGVGDTVFPGILAVSASIYLPAISSFILTANLWVAVGTVSGGILGYLILSWYVMGGKPQAGLPFLNGGSIIGYVAAYLVMYGDIGPGMLGL